VYRRRRRRPALTSVRVAAEEDSRVLGAAEEDGGWLRRSRLSAGKQKRPAGGRTATRARSRPSTGRGCVRRVLGSLIRLKEDSLYTKSKACAYGVLLMTVKEGKNLIL
jgi:hypothetical protein